MSMNGTDFNFNPLRYLATMLIAKNEDRKAMEKKRRLAIEKFKSEADNTAGSAL